MKKLFLTFTALASLSSTLTPAFGMDQIVRPYWSARSAGMGGVRITTGLYDENFFGNPARVTQNPEWKVDIFDIFAESNSSTLSNVSNLLSGGDTLAKAAATKGQNNHARVQTAMPSVYWPNMFGGKNSMAFALLTSSQFDLDLHRYYSIEPTTVIDIGPAVTYGRKFLEDDSLSVGITGHATYRLATRSGFGILDVVKGSSLSPLNSGGDGSHLEFDLGSSYLLPWHYQEMDFSTGLSINNLLGGRYSNLGVRLLNTANRPPAQPRTLNFGASAKRATLWKFSDAVAALEFTDIGNNPDGSWFKTLHAGSEIRWGLLAFRLGLNQGYFAGGVGLDLIILEIDFATYGEELTTNVGGYQDRRYTFRIAITI